MTIVITRPDFFTGEAERITTLLTSTNKPLKEIALSFGFSSQAHLSRYYKKQTGHTPSDVRRVYQK